MNDDATINKNGGIYEGMDRYEARKVLELNKAERHLRGGLATKEKYSHLMK